jgi:ubiquinone/menaquinone biosynthesis C-methylase UbiE
MICRTGTELIDPCRVLERVGIRERMRVVDFGCGALGHWAFAAAQLVGPNGTVFAVDILRDVLQLLERNAKSERLANVKSIWSDFDVYGATSVPEGEIDLLILANDFPHSRHPDRLVKEIARLVKRGGKVLVVEWKPSASGWGSNRTLRVDPARIKLAFDIPEFELKEEFDAGPAHYALVFLRTDAKHVPPNLR